MTPIELMKVWSETGKVPSLSYDEVQKFYGTLESLAKLLAAEDIAVNFFSSKFKGRNCNGDFDPKNRILSLAPFGDDMLHTIPGILAHEVSHAIYTTYTDEVKLFMEEHGVPTIWNIIEDGYCERQLCMKYPGVKKYLKMRFDEIMQKNWPAPPVNFVTDTTNILNHVCKGEKYGYPRIPYHPGFLPDELQLLRDAELCNNSDVMGRIDQSLKLMEMIIAANKRINGDEHLPSDDDIIQHLLVTDDEDEEEPSATNTPTPNTVDTFNAELDFSGLIDEDKELASRRESITLTNIFHLPSANQIFNIQPSYDVLQYNTLPGMALNGLPVALVNEKKYQTTLRNFGKHNMHAKEIAQMLFRQFSARANAENLKHVNYRTSGMLDPVRLTQYKIFDDIFSSVRIQPNQINHGFVIMLDWSGSMAPSSLALCMRVMELAHFAMLAKVEMEIWLYTDANPEENKQDKVEAVAGVENIILRQAKFIHVLSTKKNSPQQISNRLFNLYVASTLIHGGWKLAHTFPGLSKQDKVLMTKYMDMMEPRGTTILESVIVGFDRLNSMRSQKKTLILMTDGADSPFDTISTAVQHKSYQKLAAPFVRGKDDNAARFYQASTILLNGVCVLRIVAKHLEELKQELDTKYINSSVKNCLTQLTSNLRSISTRAVIEVMRSSGINVVALGWQLKEADAESALFCFNLGGDLINILERNSINVSKSRHLSRYAHTMNSFIDELSKRLLGDTYNGH